MSLAKRELAVFFGAFTELYGPETGEVLSARMVVWTWNQPGFLPDREGIGTARKSNERFVPIN